MIKLNDVYRRVEDKWVSRFILDEVVIMPLCRSQDDMQYIYSISNQTGSKVWQLLDGSHCVKEIQEILKSVYEGQAEVIEREVLEFIEDIFEAKLIEEDKAKRKKINDSQCQIPQKKKTYKSPEITKVKMQPEQAVLSCCLNVVAAKSTGTSSNVCADSNQCWWRDICHPYSHLNYFYTPWAYSS